MNTIQKIMNVLMNPNAELINIISIPCTLIEIIIYVNMCLVLLNIKTDKKHKYLCICFIFFISMIFKLFISAPYNIICNTLIFVLAFLLFFKTSILLIVYTCLFIMYQFFKHFKVNISLFTHLNKKDYISILGTVILGFITVFLQLYITAFYNNILPHAIILLSICCLIAYFFVSIFNIIKTKQLEIANRDINNLQLYNNTLKIMYDNIRAFKHDFHNIMNGIGRICNS